MGRWDHEALPAMPRRQQPERALMDLELVVCGDSEHACHVHSGTKNRKKKWYTDVIQHDPV